MKNYTKELNTYLFRRSWGELFNGLSNEDAGRLIKAVYSYVDGIEPKEEDFNNVFLISSYRMIVKQLNYSAKKHLMRLNILQDQ